MTDSDEIGKDGEEKKVGYKSPPEHSKWKKGQSGNPSGKKTKAETLQQTMKRLLGQEIVVQKNGTQMSMTHREAMATSMITKAMKGDVAGARFIHGVLGEDLASRGTAVPEMTVTDADIACLRSHADWVEIIERAIAERDGTAEAADDADETE